MTLFSGLILKNQILRESGVASEEKENLTKTNTNEHTDFMVMTIELLCFLNCN